MANGRKSTRGAKQHYDLKMLSKSASQHGERTARAGCACLCTWKLSMHGHKSKPKLGEDQTTCPSSWFSLPEARQIPHFQTSWLGTRRLKMWGLPSHKDDRQDEVLTVPPVHRLASGTALSCSARTESDWSRSLYYTRQLKARGSAGLRLSTPLQAGMQKA